MSISISCNRILANHTNQVREAAIAVSAQRASTDLRLLAQNRSGGGRLALAGPYTGAADTDIDVEIVSGSGALRASTPTINGVGNGTLAITALGVGAVPETYTFTLLDAGTPDVAAELDFFGVVLAARAAGAAGNALALTVTRNLTDTPLPYATLDPITAGTDTLDGPEWDWGQPPATGAGIPAGALRVRFERFPAVHRAWKVWDAGRFVYRLDPAPAFDIPADTRVLEVSGDYTLTLSDGVDTEVYPGVVTVYDFVTQIEARSALAEVRGIIARDTAPGGMAVTEIPLRTDAHALPVKSNVRSTAFRGLDDIVVAGTAPTENITLAFLGRSGGGGGAWSVTGGVSGALPNASTGVPYTHGPVSFTIPALAAPAGTAARISAVVSLTSRTEEEGLPAICFKPLRLGVAATDKSVTFTYRKRPPADCVCENMPPLHVSDACLGLTTGDTDMALDAEYQTRLEALYQHRRDFHASNVGPDLAVSQDMNYLDAIVAVFAEALAEVYESADARTEWDLALTEMQGFTDWLQDGVGLNAGGYPQVGGYVANRLNGHYYAVLGATYNGAPQDSFTAALPVWSDAVFWKTDGSTFVHTVPASGEYYEYTITLDDVGTAPPSGQNLGLVSYSIDDMVRKYGARMDYCRTLAGIVPKSDASGAGGSSCWRDDPAATHWWVDESGEYLPAFTNKPYVSVTRDETGKIVSTREFGFGIVTPCEHRLKPGDAFTVTIRGAVGTYAYAEGDTITIPVISAAAAPFTAGADGDPTQTWTVRGSLAGALADWLYNPAAPAAYSDGEITAELAPGGIPFAAGDAIRVAVEGGRLRWRRDGGAWTEADLFDLVHDLGDGLSLTAVPGAAPSFVTGDAWSYRAVAKYGASRMRQPRIGHAFAFDTDGVVIDIDLGAVAPIEGVLLALHTLPASATLTIDGGDGAPTDWSVTPAVRHGAILAVPTSGATARYLRVTIAGTVTGGTIGWLWAGLGWQPTVGASDLVLSRAYGLTRGSGQNPAALYRGKGQGGRWSWQLEDGCVLIDATLDALTELLDHVAASGLEPVALVPDIRAPERTSLAILDTDSVDMVDHMNWQTNKRAVSLDLPFRAVLQ